MTLSTKSLTLTFKPDLILMYLRYTRVNNLVGLVISFLFFYRNTLIQQRYIKLIKGDCKDTIRVFNTDQ